MSVISITDFENWKRDPVTQAFFSAVVERIEDAKNTLSVSAGQDGISDNFLRGFIHGQREILDVELGEDGNA